MTLDNSNTRTYAQQLIHLNASNIFVGPLSVVSIHIFERTPAKRYVMT